MNLNFKKELFVGIKFGQKKWRKVNLCAICVGITTGHYTV